MNTIKPYLFRTRPFYVPKIWGGRKLQSVLRKDLPGDAAQLFGEAWEVADLPQGQAQIESGALAGKPLGEAVAAWGADLFGTRAEPGAFPLLVKIIDAADDLSVQVHPSAEDVRTKSLEGEGKDEAWVVLDAAANASILHGLRQPMTPTAFGQAMAGEAATACLRRVAVQAGDVIRVAPGTVHAIGKGVLLLEVQQPSDTTYRVYDYNRKGLDGNPRALHLAQALQVIDFESAAPAAIAKPRALPSNSGELAVLVDVPPYRIERFRPAGPSIWSVDTGSCQILFASQGTARVRVAEEAVTLRRGQSAVVPACAGEVEIDPLDAQGRCEVIAAGLGGKTLIEPRPTGGHD